MVFKSKFKQIFLANTEQIWKLFLKEIFLSPGYDRVASIKSRIFFILRKFGVVWVYIDLPGVVIWQHIHPCPTSFIRRRGLTRFKLGFLGLRIIKCRNSSDILEWGRVPYRQETSQSLLTIIFKPGLDTPKYL